MGCVAAARLGDQIGHVSIWARLARVGLRVATGMLEALAVGALLTLAVGGSVATMGCGAIIAGGLIAGFIGAASGWSDYKEKKIQEVTENLGSMDITGALGQLGSPDVLVNGKAAMRAIIDSTVCSKHSEGPPPPIAEGSDSIFIDTYPAARKGDKLVCSAKIVEGSPNVFFGGNKTAYLEMSDDKELWETGLELAIGLAMGRGKLPGKLACMGLGMVAGMAGDALGRGFRSFIGYPVNPATGGKVLDGSDDTDFVLPGPLPIEWRRFYNSHDNRNNMLFGRGWGLPYTVELHVTRSAGQPDALTYVDHQGRKIDLPMVEPGHALFNTAEGFILGRSAGGYFDLTTLDQQHFQFNAVPEGSGLHILKLQRLADRHGNWLRFRYDEAGRLVTITDHIGRILRLRYEAGSNITAIDLEQGAPEETTGRLVSYRYDRNGQLAEVIDRLGMNAGRFAYQDGLMTRQERPGGFVSHYAWETRGSGPEGDRRVVRHWTDDGEAWDIEYQVTENGGTTTAHDAFGRKEIWTWNKLYSLTGYTNQLGHTWALEWNDVRELLSVTRPDGQQWRYAYDDNGLRISETDPLGRVTETRWDERWFEPRKIVQPDGAKWLYEYDDHGNATVEIDPAGNHTIYAYDNRGLPIEIVDALGGRKQLTWTPRAQLASFTDCSNRTTRYTYDGYSNLATITDALGQETRWVHDAVGRPITTTQPDGAQHTWYYDPDGRLIGATDPLGRATRYQLDPRGRLRQRHDAAGRGISFDYDPAGRLNSLTPENGQPYDFAYDAADRLLGERRPDGTRIAYEYDSVGQVIAVTHFPILGDDVFTEVENEVLGGIRPQITDTPRYTELIRDALGQLIEKRHADGQIERYNYDPAGRLIEAVRLESDAGQAKPVHTVQFAYDKLGNPVSETATDHRQGTVHTLHHEHDALGNRLATQLPALPGRGPRSLHYLHYGSGHLHQVRLSEGEYSRIVADIERDELHRETQRTQGTVHTRYLLDPVGRRLGSWTRAMLGHLPDTPEGFAAALQQGASRVDGLARGYRYDLSGELRERQHGLKGQERLEYDPTGRLLSASRYNRTGQGQSEQFAYDPAGNLLDTLNQNQPGLVRDNRIRVFEDKRYAYDGLGRLIEKRAGHHTHQSFLWDAADRLVQVTTTRRPGSDKTTTQTTRYEYDALGRRVASEDAFGRTSFIWEGMRLIEERRQSKAVAYVYEPGGYVPLARIEADEAANDERETDSPPTPPTGSNILYFHNDPSGLPEELTDEMGRIRWRAAYKAWGNTLAETWEAVGLDGYPLREAEAPEGPQPVAQNLRYQGQYLDRETGLHYNTFRYYDPDIGRFISPDPIGLMGGMNLYQYAPNPVSWIDPWGYAVTPLDAPGYSTYGLYKPGATEPYYVGHTGQKLEDRLDQHVGRGRATAGQTEIRPLGGQEGSLTYSQSKGYEQAYREKYNTKTGFPGNVIEPINKGRTDSRGQSHYGHYEDGAKKAGIKPKRGC